MDRNQTEQLIVLSAGSFPYGEAATNRHVSYLKGLAESGINVKVYLLLPGKNQSPLSNANKGTFNGIDFQYVTWKKAKTKGSFSKIWLFLKSIQKAKKLINSELKENQNTTLLLLVTHPLIMQVFIRFARRKTIRVFHERTEFPFITTSGRFSAFHLRYYYRQIRKLDGLFVITKALKDFFLQYLPAEKIALIPMTVEPERFSIPKTRSQYGTYIAYCGSMYSDKDGVPILLQAFDLFAEKHTDIQLVLIGDTSNATKFQVVEKTFRNLKYKDRVFFTGKVERDQMPELLVNASALALARPDNIQAKGGFPTKLGEYLATGNPVIVTKVGEIPDYLSHMENAYLSEPDSVKAFSDQLDAVFSDYVRATEIGKKGKELANSVFHYKTQAEKLIRFFSGELTN
jgi:glycosyltransferase involved in cell wall biosynthesis